MSCPTHSTLKHRGFSPVNGVQKKDCGFSSPAATRPWRPGEGGQRGSPCPPPPFVSNSVARGIGMELVLTGDAP